MGDRANVIVVRETGAHELYRTGWAVGLDLDLLDGPDAVLAMLPELRQDGWWLDDTMAQGGVLLDLGPVFKPPPAWRCLGTHLAALSSVADGPQPPAGRCPHRMDSLLRLAMRAPRHRQARPSGGRRGFEDGP